MKAIKKNNIRNVAVRLLILICSVLIVYLTVTYVPIYNLIYEDVLKASLNFVNQNRDLSKQQKLEGKFGFDVRYLEYLKKNTPENAVIIMPPDSVIHPGDESGDFNNLDLSSITSKIWTSYFVYPRKLVYEREKSTNPLYSEATHVAVINYWGYEKLDYNVSEREKYIVMPIKKS